jgi:hypothetical protein
MPYKILSLDGGGTWALVQARVLRDIYGDINGHEILRQFDMAIANSGGSLVLASLCNNMTPSQIISVFNNQEQRNAVFSPIGWRYASPLEPIVKLFTDGPRYLTEDKRKGLTEVLASFDPSPTKIVTRFLDELPSLIGNNYNDKPVDLVICGFDYYRRRESFFRSNRQSQTDKFDRGQFYRLSLVDAIHASSNAPVRYFEKPSIADFTIIKDNEKTERRQNWFWDGAVGGFNNPVLAGLVEAITNKAAPDMDYRILSLGTSITKKAVIADYQTSDSYEVRKVYELNKDNPYVIADTRFHYVDDIEKLSTSILSDPPDSATFIAYSFLHPDLDSESPKIVRINPCLSPVREGNEFVVPAIYRNNEKDKEAFRQLMEMDMDATKDDDVKLIDGLCDRFIVHSKDPNASLPNQLIRGNVDAGNGYLGYPTYFEAKQRWNELNALP